MRLVPWQCLTTGSVHLQMDGKTIDQYIVAGPPQAIQEQHPVHTMQTVMDTQVHLISSPRPRAPPHYVNCPATLLSCF